MATSSSGISPVGRASTVRARAFAVVQSLAVLVALTAIGLSTVVGFVGTANAGELIRNGGFETGDFGPYWVHGAFRGIDQNPNNADHLVVPDLPFSGNYSVLLGFKYTAQRRDAAGYMYQDVQIPDNISIAELRFKVRMQGYDSTPYDPFVAQIRGTNNFVRETVLRLTFPEYNYIFKDSGWLDDDDALPVGFDVTGYGGQTVRIYFEQANTLDDLYETWTYVDDVSLVFRKFVDLAVEGNGDDEFGAVGSGLGGFADRVIAAGDTLVFALDVENEGIDADSYDLSINAPPGWDVWLDTGSGFTAFPYATGAIASGDIRSYDVYVIPPAGTPANSYDVTLDAVSAAHGNRFDSVRLGVTVLETLYGTDLVVDGNGFGAVGDGGSGGFALKVAPWDSTVTYSLELINTGDAAAAYEVSFAGDPSAATLIRYLGTPYTALFNTQAIAPGATAMMTLEMSVANPEPGGDYETIVRAAAVPDTLKRDTIRTILRLSAPRVDLIIGSSGDDIYDDTFSGLGGSSSDAGERGTSVVFPVLVQNESSSPDSFLVSWVSPGVGWIAVLVDDGADRNLPFTTPTIAANAQREYGLKITIPGGASFGTYASHLNAVSIMDNRVSESVTAAVSVTDAGQLDMVIDGSGAGIYGPVGTGLGGSSTRDVVPGDSTVFVVDLRNLTGTNSVDIEWNTPAGWRVTFDGQTSPVSGYPAGVYDFKVVVPMSAPGGTVDIILDGRKSDKPFYMDSVLGRVNVIRVRAVDVIVDGNGDGSYGPAGTGLGGLSTQMHSAPAILNYTVELQNEGSDADDYTVTWNQIPFWQARLNGSSSPHVTATVAAGSYSLFTFEVVVPADIAPGGHSYIIDIVSNSDSDVVESIEARITVVGPPWADLVIDGNGDGVHGLYGTGEGGISVRGSAPGGAYNASLEIHNVGSFSDSFQVDWEPPPGWPVGSVVINDGTTDHTSPFWTATIGPGASANYTVKVQVPADAGMGSFPAIVNAKSSLPPNAPESVTLITKTTGVVMGIVFDDRDHDGVFGGSDVGIGGVQVIETNSGAVQVTGGDGRYVFDLAGGDVLLVEQNLSGFVSLSPDTVGPTALVAGDTLNVDFADVAGLRLTAGVVSNGVPGGYVDFPHRLDAGTRGTVTLTATTDPGVVTMFFVDENENGVFDGTDRALVPGDLDMDPGAGNDHIALILRVFVPMTSPVGATHRVDIDVVQVIESTPLTAVARATDAVVVVDEGLGRLTLAKQVDSGAAAPGDVLTYTITFANAGADSVRNILIVDPISSFVDPVADAFGPGMDVEWRPAGGGTRYLTLDPGDADECEYRVSERLIRLVLSKNSPFYLRPGETGTMTYRAVVK